MPWQELIRLKLGRTPISYRKLTVSAFAPVRINKLEAVTLTGK